MDRMVAHAQNGPLMIFVPFLVFGQGDEIFLACLPVPTDYAFIFGDRVYFLGGCLYSGYALGMPLIGHRLAYFYILEM